MLPGWPTGISGNRQVGVAQLHVVLKPARGQDHAAGPDRGTADDRARDGSVHDDQLARRRLVADLDPPPLDALAHQREQRRPGSLSVPGNEQGVRHVTSAREVRPRRQHPAERLQVDRRGRAAQRAEPRRQFVEPTGERLEHRSRRLAEAQRVEVIHRGRAPDVEQEATGVQAVAAAETHLLGDEHPRARVVCLDRGGGPGYPETQDEHVDVGHDGGPVIARNESLPSHPSAASRTIS